MKFIAKTRKNERGRGWLANYECECGKVQEKAFMKTLYNDKVCRSCATKKQMTSHGLSTHKLRVTLTDMEQRCYNAKSKSYKNYGARGISVCDEWKGNIQAFHEWAMQNDYEDTLDIDRIDNDKNYSPDNCRFVARSVNIANTRLIHTTNTTGYRGVCWSKQKKKYRGRVNFEKKVLFQVFTATAEEAARLRDKYVVECNLPHPLNFEHSDYLGSHEKE